MQQISHVSVLIQVQTFSYYVYEHLPVLDADMDHVEFLGEVVTGGVAGHTAIAPLEVAPVDPHHHGPRVTHIQRGGEHIQIQAILLTCSRIQ